MKDVDAPQTIGGKLLHLLTAALISVILVAFFVNIDFDSVTLDLKPDTAGSVADGWRWEEDGETKTGSLPLKVPVGGEESVTFARFCTAEELRRGMLMVSNERQNLAIALDGEEIFRLDDGGRGLPTSIYEYCLADLPEKEEGAYLALTFSGFRGDECLFQEAYLCSPAEAFAHMVLSDGFQVVVLILCAALMLVVGLASVWLTVKGQHNRRFDSIFFLMVCVSLWNATNMWSSPLIGVSYELLNWTSYTSLMLLPIPVTMFAYFSTANYRSKLLRGMTGFSIAMALLQQMLYLFHVLPLYDMVSWVHVELALVSLSCVYSQIRDNRIQPSPHKKMLIIIFALPVLIVASVVPLFWLSSSLSYSLIFQLGMLQFMMLLLADAILSLVTRRIDMKKTEAELAMLQSLSFKDGLTGMGNRRAFDEHLERIEKKTLDNALLVFMDLNGLKNTNDSFGHAAGDELIITTGECISSVFGVEGSCYRLGGDEFAAVIENPTQSNERYNAMLNAAIERYGAGQPGFLSIARGYERLISPEGIRRTSSLWKSNADREMYADKMRTKMLLGKEDSAMVAPEHIDEMSGILNTQGFRQNAVQLICQHPDKRYSLWYYNIKRFKFVNDFFGYEVGDKLIKYISSLLLESIREGESCGRISADCFVSLHQISEEKDIQAHFDYIASHLSSFLKMTRISYDLEVGVGIYCLKPEDMKAPNINQLIDWANVAHRSVKNLRGSQYAVFDEEMWQHQWRELYINQTLEAAIQRGDISVWFQPQYNYVTGRMIGAEALCRWNHESLGWIAPAEFIAALEQTGQISRLDAYVREEACRLMRRWRASTTMEPVSVSVNISRNSVLEDDYIERLDALLARYELPRSALRLEITESAYMNHPEMLVEAVNLLHKHGYTVEMDDFGSGFSSLNMLKDVPVDLLKLDIRFLQGETRRSKGAQIVNAVVRMARELHIPVLTEGVEDREQAQYLASIGCPLMQGYYFSRPLPVPEFENLLCQEKEKRCQAEETVAQASAPVATGAAGEVCDVLCADYELNSASQIVMCDEEFTRITGYDIREITERRLTQNDLIPEEDRAAYWAIVNQKRAAHALLCLKHRIRRRDGRTLTVHCLGEPMVDEYTGESRTAVHLQCEYKELIDVEREE